MPSSDELHISGLVIRPHEHVVVAQGGEVDLTSREFEILLDLAEHPGWVFSVSDLSSAADHLDYSPESVSVHVSRLRHKLAVAGADRVIETVRGSGYRLRSADEGNPDAVPLEAARAVLRESTWQLHEAALEVERAGGQSQVEAAAEALDEARHSIYRILAE